MHPFSYADLLAAHDRIDRFRRQAASANAIRDAKRQNGDSGSSERTQGLVPPSHARFSWEAPPNRHGRRRNWFSRMLPGGSNARERAGKRAR